MWHLLTAHQQESSLPFSSWQSLSCCLSHVAKRSTPKPHGPLSPSPKPCSPPSSMAAEPGFKSQRPSSSAAPFPTPPTISYTCQRSCIVPALLGYHSKSGQVGPVLWSQSSPSSHAGTVTRGTHLPPSYSWVEVTPIPQAQSIAAAV